MRARNILLTSTILILALSSRFAGAEMWVAAENRILKVSSGGKIIHSISSVFDRPYLHSVAGRSITVSPIDGSVWVNETNSDRIFKLSATGQPLLERNLVSPTGIGIDPNDGSVWISALPHATSRVREVVKLDSNGNVRVKVSGFSSFVSSIAVGSTGAIWVADRFNDQVVKLFGTDGELDGYDASGPSGPHHFRKGGFSEPLDLVLDRRGQDPENVWVADRNNGQAVKLSPDGVELVRTRPARFHEVQMVSVNPVDGSVWVGRGRIAKLRG